MMIIMQFTFQIVLLGIGFGVGYWLLITANTQQDLLKNIGQALGGILIVMAMILAIFSCYYSMKITNRGYMQSGCNRQKLIQPQQERPTTNNQDFEKMEKQSGDEGQPIKRNIKDHE